MDIKIIKTEEDYKEALKMVEGLILMNTELGSAEADKLQLLTTLIEDYEKNNFPSSLPDPIEAIKFRMEQLGLSDSDMVHFIGSKSKVSEVLSGKTPLTLKMIRTLEKELSIPAKVLVQQSDEKQSVENLHLDVLKEIKERGYLDDLDIKKDRENIISVFFAPFLQNNLNFSALFRQTNYRTSPTTNKQALLGWLGCVLHKAKKVKIIKKYKAGTVDLTFMRKLVQLSIKDNAPILVREFLKKHGIILVIEKQFDGTKLDGASIFIDKNNPVIALTLRYDRVDNFWFTLMHELAHISLHINTNELFFDELDEIKGKKLDEIEQEADQLASESLVPSEKWEISPAKLIPSKLAAISLAKELGVNVAIIAGKVRHEKDFKYLSRIVGDAKVRQFFPDINFN